VHRLLNWALVPPKDFGWLLMTLGRVNVKRLEGAEWSVTYIGEDYTHSEKELHHVLFSDRPRVSQVDRVFIWQVPGMMLQLLEEADMLVCEVNRLIRWQPRGTKLLFRSPPWVRMELDVSCPINEIMARIAGTRRQDLRRAQEQGFTYALSRAPADLNLFYHEMYVPHILSRHQERAIIEPFEAKQAMFRRGGLIVVKYEGEPVAAALGHTVGDTFVLGSVGVHHKHFDLIKKGVTIALYWYTIEWARQNGLRHVDFGMTRPRFHDGVFWAKQRWGMQVRPYLLNHTHWLFIAQDPPTPLRRFLNEAGFIAESYDGYRCVVFEGEVACPGGRDLARMEKAARQAGLEGLLIL